MDDLTLGLAAGLIVAFALSVPAHDDARSDAIAECLADRAFRQESILVNPADPITAKERHLCAAWADEWLKRR